MIEITRHYEQKDMFGNTFEDYRLKKEQIGIITETPDYDLVMGEPTKEPEPKTDRVDLDNRKPKDTTPQVSSTFKDALQRIAEKFYKN